MSASDGRPTPLPIPEVPPEKQVSPELRRSIEQLAEDAADRPFSRDLMRRFDTLVDLLVTRGHLTPYHARLLRKIEGGDGSVVRLSTAKDKRAVRSSDMDCVALMPLCKGRCCALDVSLSAEDIAEGRLQWDLHQPYVLRKDPDHGYCACHGADGRCTVYDDRPAACRAYDCAVDPRVWLDFEAKIPAPMPWWLVPADERGQPRRAPPTAPDAGEADGADDEDADGDASGADRR